MGQSARRLLLQADASGVSALAERLVSGSLASSAGSAVAASSGALSRGDQRLLNTLSSSYRLVLERAFGSEASALQQVRACPLAERLLVARRAPC